MENNKGTSYDNRPKGRSRAPLNQNLITASNENQNEKIEELTDEQLKQVAGGFDPPQCISLPHCIRQAERPSCECLEWEEWGNDGSGGANFDNMVVT